MTTEEFQAKQTAMSNEQLICLVDKDMGAIAALDEGKRIQRAGWNGKGMFVFK